jgi:hypothetical protein
MKSNIVQIIFGWRKIKFVQIKGNIQGSTLTLVCLSGTNRKTIRTSEYCWALVRLDKCFCYKESSSNRKVYREFQVWQKLYIFIKQTR